MTRSDPRHQDGSYIDCYVLEAPAGQRLQINMTSLAFDSYLAVGEGSCAQMTMIEQDDDSGGGVNALIVRETTGRPLIILANSAGAGATGAYSLRASPASETPSSGVAPSGGRAPATRVEPAVRQLAVGQTVNGTLTPSARLMSDGTFFDCFAVPTRAGQTLQIDMTSYAFDSYLLVGTGSCDAFTTTGQNDDGGGGLNARVVHQGDGGQLLIRANTIGVGDIGDYQLRVSPVQSGGQGQAATGGGAYPVTRLNVGQTVNGTLSASDRTLPDNSHFDCFTVRTLAGQRLQIDMTSSDFDSYLSVGTGSCEALNVSTRNDDGGDGLNARIVNDGDGGTLFVQANSASGGETGAYQLRVSEVRGQGGAAPVAGPAAAAPTRLPTVAGEWRADVKTCFAAYNAMVQLRAEGAAPVAWGNVAGIDYAARQGGLRSQVDVNGADAFFVELSTANFRNMSLNGMAGQDPTGQANQGRPLAEYLTLLGACDRANNQTPVTRY